MVDSGRRREDGAGLSGGCLGAFESFSFSYSYSFSFSDWTEEITIRAFQVIV
jgi:hypothetical protein